MTLEDLPSEINVFIREIASDNVLYHDDVPLQWTERHLEEHDDDTPLCWYAEETITVN